MRDTKGDFVRGAFIASLMGGALLAFIMVIPPAAGGDRLWPGTQFAAYPLMGSQVFEPGFRIWPMVVGTTLHFAIAFVWSLLFVLALRKRTRVMTMIASVPAGLVVWLVMHQIVLRLVAPEVLAQINPLVGIVQHVVFMGAVAATLVLLQPQNWRFRRTKRALAA